MPRERESARHQSSTRPPNTRPPPSRVGRTSRDAPDTDRSKSGHTSRHPPTKPESHRNSSDNSKKPTKNSAMGMVRDKVKDKVQDNKKKITERINNNVKTIKGQSSANTGKQKTMTEAVSGAAKEAKNKGNAAFKDGDWDEAIKQYTRALKADSKDHVCLANRSAAFLKRGENEKALEDAERCIKLNPSYAKGHIRKAGAFHAMKKFTAEVKAYQVGLEECPDDNLLRTGLDQAKRSRSSNSKASQAARKTEATRQAAASVKKKALRSENVSDFVKATKKNLELQMAALEAQLDMVNELEKMKPEEKIDLLYTLLDKDKDGSVDAKELADGLQRRDVALSFGDAIDKSIELVAMYDENGDAMLDRDEFGNFVDKMVVELNVTIGEFCEFMVYELLFSDAKNNDEYDVDVDNLNHEVKERGHLLSALHDPRMESLFVLFDRNCDGVVSFKEVACGLYQLTKDMEESAKATTGLLLMMDVDDKRVLVFEQFAKLILAIAAAAGTSFDEVANDLTFAMTSPDAGKFDRETLRALTLAERDYKKARDRARAEKTQAKIMDALSYGRTLRLFDLWDANGDGHINFEELFVGLQRYQAAAAKENNKKIDVEQVAKQLMALDTDGDHSLDREEFATAIVTYADAMKTDLHQLIDFMCVVTALERVM